MKKTNSLKSNNKGFSLAEMLMVVLILLLVTSGIVGGIPAIRDAYELVVVRANAQPLLSTAVHEITSDLKTASDITCNIDSCVFISENRGYRMMYQMVNNPKDKNDKYIVVYGVKGDGSVLSSDYLEGPIRLITDQTLTNKLYVKLDSISYASGIFDVKLSVHPKTGNDREILATTLKINPLNE